jgi:hypothetical protein
MVLMSFIFPIDTLINIYCLIIDNMYRRELGVIAAVLSLIASVTFGLSMAPTAFAQNDPLNNDFGQGAAGLGTSGQMGEHSSNPPADLSPDTPQPERQGIGNVGELLCPQLGKLTPDELARVLSSPPLDPSDCNLARP